MALSPTQSYRIWFTPRTGSTLLCKGLALTGVAGKPGEFFNIAHDSTLLATYNVKNYTKLRQHLWQLGMTDNGVFSIKHSLFSSLYQKIAREISQIRKTDPPAPGKHEAFWEDLFPNTMHIYLTRRNKVRQAVSWWKAIKSEQWHLGENESRKLLTEEFYEQSYDFAALSHLFKEACLREAAFEAYFAEQDIHPLTVVYEDLIRDYPGHLRKILSYLNLSTGNIVTLDNSFYRKTADNASEVWVQRFRQDLQDNWDKIAW